MRSRRTSSPSTRSRNWSTASPRAPCRLQQAGWDGIEINAAADHLFHGFLSRFWNKRDDKYGPQSMENRTRFIVDVIKEIKKRCGQDFPVQILMNAIEVGLPARRGAQPGRGQGDRQDLPVGGRGFAPRAFALGGHAPGLLQPGEHVLSRAAHSRSRSSRRSWTGPTIGALAQVPLAAEIKKVVTIPVMTVGLIDADSGEAILREGKADLIGINRRFFADNNWANKVREGREEDIQPCTHCGTCNTNYNEVRYCRINACFGTESYEMAPLAARRRRWSWWAPARPACRPPASRPLRGHDVTLYEKGRYLGGAVALASMVKGFDIEDLPEFLRFFRDPGQEDRASRSSCTSEFDDAGARRREARRAGASRPAACPPSPKSPGFEGRNVVKTGELYGMLRFFIRLVGPKMLRELTKIWMPVGKKVVIIGGAIQGCQLGEFLIKRGRKVTIVEEGDEMGKWLVPERKTRLFYWFDKKGIERLTGVKLVEITKKGMTVETKEGETALARGRHHHPGAALLAEPGGLREDQGQGRRGLPHRRLHRPGRHPRRDQGRLEHRQRPVSQGFIPGIAQGGGAKAPPPCLYLSLREGRCLRERTEPS